MTRRIFTTMEERREAEEAVFLGLLNEATAHGAKVYTVQELYPDVDWNNPDAPQPKLTMQELMYSYENRDYQCIIHGTSAYHHRLHGNVFSGRPYRRDPPKPHGPWATQGQHQA